MKCLGHEDLHNNLESQRSVIQTVHRLKQLESPGRELTCWNLDAGLWNLSKVTPNVSRRLNVSLTLRSLDAALSEDAVHFIER